MNKIILAFWAAIFLNCAAAKSQTATEMAQQFLEGMRYGDPAEEQLKRLEMLTPEKLEKDLPNDDYKKAFWINLYNATVQYLLLEDSTRYENRDKFFQTRWIKVAGVDMSLDEMEHGILRRSEIKYGLGYVKNPFVSDFIKRHQVEVKDSRIHFALNCGAGSCPPISFYSPENINEELDLSVMGFLKATTSVEGNTVYVTRLFQWFKGDFGSDECIIKFLKRYDALARGQNPKKIEYLEYDWKLAIGVYE
jgi:hypothetical protein